MSSIKTMTKETNTTTPQMTSAQIDAPKKTAIRKVDIPSVGPNDVLIEVKSSGICGTDLHIWHGSYELANYPVIPGHEFSGVVVKVGSKVKNFKLNDRVTADPNLPCYSCFFCHRKQFNQCLYLEAIGVTRDGGFASYVVVPESNIFPISDGMSFAEAALLEPLACVVWGLKQVQIQVGDSMLIFGAGPMGILMMQAVRAAGASSVTIIDKESSRLELAKSLGADHTALANDFNTETAQKISAFGFDIVADATGVPKVIEGMVTYARAGAKLWVFGVAPEGSKVAMPPDIIFRKDLKVIGSFALNKTFTEAIALVEHGAVNLKPLISHELPLEDFEQALHLAEQDPNRMKVQIKFED